MAATAATQAAEFYVATGGDDNAPGTLAQPFASIARGQQAASPGDTVWIRGGVYEYAAGAGASEFAVRFDKSGAPGARINYWAYPGETPVFDFYNYLPVERIRGFSVQADYLHFKGLELRGVQQVITNVNESWAIRVESGDSGGDGGDFNIFEQLDLHHNEGPGLFILNGGNNLVLNSDSHHNYDPDRGGENADGFGSHSVKDGNRFIGTRAWENSDDGYDFIHSLGVVVVEDSWAWRNGYVPDTDTAAGNGGGFKAGGYRGDFEPYPSPEDVPRNVLRGNIAFDNRVWGFNANGHPGGIDWINNTAFDNPRGFDLNNNQDSDRYPEDHYLRNNIAFGNETDLFRANQQVIDDEQNSWNSGFGVSPGDFVSLDPAGLDAPRMPDGGLPEIPFLRLSAGSDLIDAGEYAGRPFLGAAPDLGAFEFDFAPEVPGDADGDGDVDHDDLAVIAAHFRDTVAHGTRGDVTGDGVVDLGDFRRWKLHAGVAAGTPAFWVPEPHAAGLLAVAIAAAGVVARRS